MVHAQCLSGEVIIEVYPPHGLVFSYFHSCYRFSVSGSVLVIASLYSVIIVSCKVLTSSREVRSDKR